MIPLATLIQLSDLHVVADGRLDGRVDPLANVRAALDRIETSDVDVAALVPSGDLTDTGDPAAYRAELLSPSGRARGRVGAALTTVDVYPDTVVAAAEPLDATELLMDTDEGTLAAAMQAAAS